MANSYLTMITVTDNQTLSSNISVFIPKYGWLHVYVTSSILGVLILCTVIGNSFVIAATLLEKNLQNVSNYLIISLAVADLMVGSLVMSLSVFRVIAKQWFLGLEICDIWVCLDILCCSASILHLVAIAIDRYWAISDVQYVRKRTATRIYFMIGIVWIISIFISIPARFHINRSHEIEVYKVIYEGRCEINKEYGYTVFSVFGAFYLPMFFMIILYGRIYMVAKARIRRQAFRKRLRSQQYAAVSKRTRGFSNHCLCQNKIINSLSESHLSCHQHKVIINANNNSNNRNSHDNEHEHQHDNQENNKITEDLTDDSESSCSIDRINESSLNLSVNLESIVSDSAFDIDLDNRIRHTRNRAETSKKSEPNLWKRYIKIKSMPWKNRPYKMSTSSTNINQRTTLPTMSVTKEDSPTAEVPSTAVVVTASVEDKPILISVTPACYNEKASQYRQRPSRILTPAEKMEHRRHKLEQQRERKAARTLAIVTGCFIICWQPFFIQATLVPFCGSCTPPDWLDNVMLWLGYCNSMLNPIIYTIFSPDFRNAFHKILFGRYLKNL